MRLLRRRHKTVSNSLPGFYLDLFNDYANRSISTLAKSEKTSHGFFGPPPPPPPPGPPFFLPPGPPGGFPSGPCIGRRPSFPWTRDPWTVTMEQMIVATRTRANKSFMLVMGNFTIRGLVFALGFQSSFYKMASHETRFDALDSTSNCTKAFQVGIQLLDITFTIRNLLRQSPSTKRRLNRDRSFGEISNWQEESEQLRPMGCERRNFVPH